MNVINALSQEKEDSISTNNTFVNETNCNEITSKNKVMEKIMN